jgi:hypothetical protein
MREHLKVSLSDSNNNSVTLELWSDEPFTVKDEQLKSELKYLAWKAFENPSEKTCFITTPSNF